MERGREGERERMRERGWESERQRGKEGGSGTETGERLQNH